MFALVSEGNYCAVGIFWSTVSDCKVKKMTVELTGPVCTNSGVRAAVFGKIDVQDQINFRL